MAVRVLRFAGFVCLFVLIIQSSGSRALNSMPDVNRHYPKALSDLKETIIKGLGKQSDNLNLFGFDLKGALVAQSMEFDLEIDNKVLPIKLLEDVNKWEYVDLPNFLVEDPIKYPDEQALVEQKHSSSKGLPTLAPFQLAGPMELWIQDAKDMRLFLPHDVDAGELKKVILADGAVVTVKGAKSVSLRHPLELPLPFNKTNNEFSSGLLTFSNHLRTGKQLVSLRITGPTSLNSPATSSPAFNRLKLKRLAPGLVELSSIPKVNTNNSISIIDVQRDARSPTFFSPNHFPQFWPVVSINGSNPNLRGLETLLSAVLSSAESRSGSFKLLRADMSAQMYVKMGFGAEKKLTGNESFWEGYPVWRTKPESVKMDYEVLAKVDGEKIVPERIVEVQPVTVEDTVAPSVVGGNVTVSKMPIVNVPFSPFAL
ncbi:hypothetical protein L2E82_24987 [Cichorium intybus]|uniref:Uncharacterized protein n=1 Tax=Cichorium intybus TaxID=13427 RepID=A0ACB9E1Z5_CICIN|nr:hypothetical protein L2E82_24987 [Cichorium intybus]